MRIAVLAYLLFAASGRPAASDEGAFGSPVVTEVSKHALLPCACVNGSLDCSERGKTELLLEDRCAGPITAVNLFANSFTSFPDGFAEASIVNASFNNLHRIPLSRQLSPLLKVLDLSRNSLQTPSEEIHSLTSLEILNVRKNYFIRNLEFLPHPCALLRFDVSHNDIRSLGTRLASCTRLQELNLGSNMITSLTDNSFVNLTALKILDLSGNALTELPIQVFSHLTQLRHLNLENINLLNLHQDVFQTLVLLKHLNLGRNSLTSLPVNIFSEQSNLLYLNMASNRFTEYPYEAINNARSSLQVLDLSSNGIQNISVIAHHSLPLLKEVYLHSNNIGELPAGIFAELRYLEVVTLNENPLSSLPQGMMHQEAQLNSVAITLDALNNDNLEKISKATHLHWATHTPQQLLSRSFAFLTNLKLLVIGRNSIVSISDNAFEGLPLLEALSLGSNNISRLSPSLFSQLTQLSKLQLWNNELTTLPEGVFFGLVNLEELNLLRNRIASLPEMVFSGLSKLKKLNLASNRLTILPPRLFADMRSLQELNVRNNELTVLPSLPESCLSLRAVSFDDNYIQDLNQTTANSWMGSGEQERYVSVQARRGVRPQSLQWVLDEPALVLATEECTCGAVRRGRALLRLCVAINCNSKSLHSPDNWIEGVRFTRRP